MASDVANPTFPPDEQAHLRAFWELLHAHQDDVDVAVEAAARTIPEFASILAAVSPAALLERRQKSRELQRLALVEQNWQPYLADLREQGAAYATMGVSFRRWFDLLASFRTPLMHHLLAAHGADPARMLGVAHAMDDFLDIAMANIGDAYLQTKEKLIARQQEAIRELSTPVLQVLDGLLILPLIGVFDTFRAHQLTEELLRAIRDRRAQVVVMDVTGVPIVDSKVANHFAQTVEAARLMGALVILTGLSPEIAQTLVSIGADLREIVTYGDLQGGLEAGRRLLGYKMERPDAPDERPLRMPRGDLPR